MLRMFRFGGIVPAKTGVCATSIPDWETSATFAHANSKLTIHHSGVAIGSSVGHAIGGFFGGGGSSEAAPQQVQAQQQQPQENQQYNNCAGAATSFTKCMDDNGGNMQICNWYLEQLKACQAAAAPY